MAIIGRPKGAKNKRTRAAEAMLRASQTAIDAGASGYIPGPTDDEKFPDIIGADYIGESLNALGEALGVFLYVARKEKNEDKRVSLYQNVAVVAEKLAPYRYPKLSPIHTAGEKRGVLERTGITEQEVFAEIMAEIVGSGELPRAVKAYLSGPPKKDANGSGGNGNGGVANR